MPMHMPMHKSVHACIHKSMCMSIHTPTHVCIHRRCCPDRGVQLPAAQDRATSGTGSGHIGRRIGPHRAQDRATSSLGRTAFRQNVATPRLGFGRDAACGCSVYLRRCSGMIERRHARGRSCRCSVHCFAQGYMICSSVHELWPALRMTQQRKLCISTAALLKQQKIMSALPCPSRC